MEKIRVLIVDDSAVVRQVLSEILSSDPSIDLMLPAGDPVIAMRRMANIWPDVIVLDVEMPRMDGITFLGKIMKERPTPVVMCSTLTEKGTETAMQAMAAGAVEIVTKPKLGVKHFLREEGADLIRSVKAAAMGRMGRLTPARRAVQAANDVENDPSRVARALSKTTRGVVAIGTSTGGTQALEYVLSGLPTLSPGIVVVQHMPEKFTAAFAKRLNEVCLVNVTEARDGDSVLPGHVLLAPGGKHMRLKRSGARYYVEVFDGPHVNRHRPSVDVLFKSVSQVAGQNAMGVIMTGMGDDGAAGLKQMHDAGALTIAQNEQTCVVYGMPKEAVKRGAVSLVAPLENISSEIINFGTKHDVA